MPFIDAPPPFPCRRTGPGSDSGCRGRARRATPPSLRETCPGPRSRRRRCAHGRLRHDLGQSHYELAHPDARGQLGSRAGRRYPGGPRARCPCRARSRPRSRPCPAVVPSGLPHQPAVDRGELANTTRTVRTMPAPTNPPWSRRRAPASRPRPTTVSAAGRTTRQRSSVTPAASSSHRTPKAMSSPPRTRRPVDRPPGLVRTRRTAHPMLDPGTTPGTHKHEKRRESAARPLRCFRRSDRTSRPDARRGETPGQSYDIRPPGERRPGSRATGLSPR